MPPRRPQTSRARLGETHAALHDLVRDEIRAAILGGRLKPGERLVEEQLAQTYGVSRNPVREAIRALATEGLVDVSTRRGAHVAVHPPQEAAETIEVRALLEAHNARLAARHKAPKVLERAAAILEKGRTAVAAGRSEALLRLNAQFHDTLGEASTNRILADLLRTLRERSALFFSPDDDGRRLLSWEEHAAILEAILAGDEDRAADLARDHVLGAGRDRVERSPEG